MVGHVLTFVGTILFETLTMHSNAFQIFPIELAEASCLEQVQLVPVKIEVQPSDAGASSLAEKKRMLQSACTLAWLFVVRYGLHTQFVGMALAGKINIHVKYDERFIFEFAHLYMGMFQYVSI